MSGQRVVGWIECMARAHPSAVQCHRSRDPGEMEIPFPSGRNFDLRAGIWISVLYLEHQNTKDLALRSVRDARHDRNYDGNVPLLAGDDRTQRGSVRAGCVSRGGATIRLQPQTAGP